MSAEPEFLTLLREAIIANSDEHDWGIEWRESWDVALWAFYDSEIAKGADPEMFMDAALALGSYKESAINYPLKFRTFYRNAKRWAAERAPIATQQTIVTPIAESDREKWGT